MRRRSHSRLSRGRPGERKGRGSGRAVRERPAAALAPRPAQPGPARPAEAACAPRGYCRLPPAGAPRQSLAAAGQTRRATRNTGSPAPRPPPPQAGSFTPARGNFPPAGASVPALPTPLAAAGGERTEKGEIPGPAPTLTDVPHPAAF